MLFLPQPQAPSSHSVSVLVIITVLTLKQVNYTYDTQKCSDIHKWANLPVVEVHIHRFDKCTAVATGSENGDFRLCQRNQKNLRNCSQTSLEVLRQRYTDNLHGIPAFVVPKNQQLHRIQLR